MIKKLENEYLTVEISERGAELVSIKSKKTGIEYLWQGNAEFWAGQSPVLFPICGRLFGGKYTYENVEYEMPIHGIARNCEFNSSVISSDKIEFELTSNEQTKVSYPFDFQFIIRYTLKNASLKTEYVVKNTGKDRMYFSVGAHPGFNVPFNKDEKFEDYYLEFSDNQLQKILFSPTCFCTGGVEKFNLTKKKLPLKHDMFDNDALFFETETDKVKLKCLKTKNAIEVSYKDMTCLGVWHKPKTSAPFVCIEPWHGLPSTDGVVDDLKVKQQMIDLMPSKKFDNSYTIKIVEG